MERSDADAAAINTRLARRLGAPLTVRVTNNARTMLSVRRVAGVRHVRLHNMFVDAPDEVIDAVARYLAHGDRAARVEAVRLIWESRSHRGRETAGQPEAPLDLRNTQSLDQLRSRHSDVGARLHKLQLSLRHGGAGDEELV